jgi:hypothetical protein
MSEVDELSTADERGDLRAATPSTARAASELGADE